jgi:hypothetical protein
MSKFALAPNVDLLAYSRISLLFTKKLGHQCIVPPQPPNNLTGMCLALDPSVACGQHSGNLTNDLAH